MSRLTNIYENDYSDIPVVLQKSRINKKIVIAVSAILCCAALVAAICHIIYLRDIGGGAFPAFNKYGIAFIYTAHEEGRGTYGGTIINWLGDEVISDFERFYESQIKGVYIIIFQTADGIEEYGLINEKGEMITKEKYDYIADSQLLLSFDSDLMLIQQNELWGCIDGRTGEVLIEPQYEKFYKLGTSSEFKAIKEQYGYVEE